MMSCFKVLLILSLAIPGLMAAPSTRLEGEFFVPLESDSDLFALVDTNSGRVRLSEVKANGNVTEVRQIPTYLPGVSGVTSGFEAGGVEHLAVANVDGNRVGFVPIDGGAMESVQTLIPGPSLPASARLSAGDPFNLVCASHYAASGHAMEHISDLGANPFTQDLWVDRAVIHDLQPLYSDPNGSRLVVAVDENSGGAWFLRIWRDQNSFLSLREVEILPAGSRIASSVIGEDGRLLVVSYLPGTTSMTLFTVSSTGQVTLEDPATAPFPLATVSAVSITGQTHGLALVASDGSKAALGEILNGKTLNIIDTFAVTPGRHLTGLVPIGAGSLLRLEKLPGTVGGATFFATHRPSGGSWPEVASGALQPVPGFDDESKATLFWYRGNPSHDDNAELLALETRRDWTRPSSAAAIPATIFAEDFVDSATGLGAGVSFSPNPPGDADFVVTNQFSQEASMSALDDGESFTRPVMEVNPPSGFYEEPQLVSATFDAESEVVYYRQLRAGREWQLYDRGIPVSYQSTYLFYSFNQETGRRSRIERRDYSFGIPSFEADFDSDGVPDAVEQFYFLNPAGGADSDGDGASDLEEIIADTDPADPSDKPAGLGAGPGGVREGVPVGDGFELLVQAANNSDIPASGGESLQMHDATGALLQTARVDKLTAPPALVSQRAVRFTQNTALPEREWLLVSTPTRFRVGGSPNSPFNGVESFRLLEVPVSEAPQADFFPGGFDLVADAEGWIDAVRDAYEDYEPVEELTELRPWHTASVVLAEQAIFEELAKLKPLQRAALGIPNDVRDFTLVPSRVADADRVPFSQEMLRTLLEKGFDGRSTAMELETMLQDPFADDIRGLAKDIEVRYLSKVDSEPTLPLPIDVLRELLHEGTIPSTFASPSLGYDLVLVRKQMEDLVELTARYRPTATWSITVDSGFSSTTPTLAFLRDDFQYVRFVDALGEPFLFEQGLGLPLQTSITVRGYTDLPAVGFMNEPVMEVLEIVSMFVPEASGEDSDGSLLDDDWERYFFGETGQNAFAKVPGSDASLLQFFLEGVDPRDGSALAVEVVDFGLDALELVLQPDGEWDLVFDWPAEYLADFDFELLVSPDLSGGSFVVEPDLVLPVAGVEGDAQIDLDPSLVNPEKNFFLLRVSLAD